MSNQRLIYGFHAINARLWQNPKSITELYVLENKNDARTREVLEKAAAEKVRVHFADMNRLNTIKAWSALLTHPKTMCTWKTCWKTCVNPRSCWC